MGTIVERRRADGTSAYRAQILIKSKGQIVHQESSTFSRRTTAEAWLKRREKELKSPGGLEAAQRNEPPRVYRRVICSTSGYFIECV